MIVLADGDEPGEAAARDCALRWKREGPARAHRPPTDRDGFQRHAAGPRLASRMARDESEHDNKTMTPKT